MFELFPLDSDELRTSFETIRTVFMSADSIALPRYEHDNYHRESGSGLGNPWFITTMWAAQYASETNDHALYEKIMTWLHAQTDNTQMFAEQMNPVDMSPLSVSPLVWSHAEYMATQLDAIARKEHE